MTAVPVLHLQTLAQVQPEAVVDEPFAAGVQPRFVAQRAQQDLQPLTEGVVAEVVQPCALDCGGHQFAW